MLIMDADKINLYLLNYTSGFFIVWGHCINKLRIRHLNNLLALW